MASGFGHAAATVRLTAQWHHDPKPAPSAEPLERAHADTCHGGAFRQKLLPDAGQPDRGCVEVARSSIGILAGIGGDGGRGCLAERIDEGCAVDLRGLLALLDGVDVQRFATGE